HRRMRQLVPERQGAQRHAVARVQLRVRPADAPLRPAQLPDPLGVRVPPGAGTAGQGPVLRPAARAPVGAGVGGTGDDEEEYEGPLTLVFGDDPPVEAEAHIAGHFDPLTGDYRWIGRISASPGVAAEYQAGNTAVLVRTADGHEASGTLTEDRKSTRL